MTSPYELLDAAVSEHKPGAVFAMFSGGHDSVCSTHLASMHPSFSGVVHVNTGVGIEATRDYVRQTCEEFGWRLWELHAPWGWYEQRCLERGMPGGPLQHGIFYQRLKDDQVRAHVRNFKRFRGDRVGLVTGIRHAESQRRMRVHPQPVVRERAQLWINPILNWNSTDVGDYMAKNDIPRNPVVDKLHRSGECLCGALADHTELDEIAFWFPDVAERLRNLEYQCYQRNLPHRWGGQQQPPPYDPDQMWLPLCQDCPTRWSGLGYDDATPD